MLKRWNVVGVTKMTQTWSEKSAVGKMAPIDLLNTGLLWTFNLHPPPKKNPLPESHNRMRSACRGGLSWDREREILGRQIWEEDFLFILHPLYLLMNFVPCACNTYSKHQIHKKPRDFPGGPVVKNLPCNAGVHRFDPWLGNQDSTCCGTTKPVPQLESMCHNGRSCVLQVRPDAAK